jgi:hypothetical protein
MGPALRRQGKSSDQGVSLGVLRIGAPLLVIGRSVTVVGRPSDVTIDYNPQTGKPL